MRSIPQILARPGRILIASLMASWGAAGGAATPETASLKPPPAMGFAGAGGGRHLYALAGQGEARGNVDTNRSLHSESALAITYPSRYETRPAAAGFIDAPARHAHFDGWAPIENLSRPPASICAQAMNGTFNGWHVCILRDWWRCDESPIPSGGLPPLTFAG